jgi:hypothetical protein
VTFTYQVNDGTTDSNVATVTLSLGDELPWAGGGPNLVSDSVPTTIRLTGDGAAPLTFMIVGSPQQGSLGYPAAAECMSIQFETLHYFCRSR